MSQCLNPDCLHQNPKNTKFCQRCGSKLQLFRRYRAIRILGRGGFGRTFLAVDEGKPSRPNCVIKQFDPQAQGTNNIEKAAQLFEREAEQLDKLGEHPQIPELLAYFTEGNQQYLVQEYIDGQDLEQILETEGKFSEHQIRDILQQILPVFDYLHQHQVIHRDIKPANIIRQQDGKLILVDFGAAKQVANSALSVTGTTIGSAGYASPEQAVGKAQPNSDIYSLGATCVRLLTQIEPFDLFDVTENEWVWRDYLDAPIDKQLGTILDNMLVLATKRRYQSATEVLQDLQPTKTQPSPTSSQSKLKQPSSPTSSTPTSSQKSSKSQQKLSKTQPSPTSSQSEAKQPSSPTSSTPTSSQKSSKSQQKLSKTQPSPTSSQSEAKQPSSPTSSTPTSSQKSSKSQQKPSLRSFEFETATVEIKAAFFGKNIQIHRRRQQAQGFSEPLGNNIELEMVYIPSGTFLMGAPESEEGSRDDERPQHQVSVPAFFLGKYPVTQAQWRAVANLPKYKRNLKPNPSDFSGDNRPVEKVSWLDAVEFCQRLSQHTGRDYRLPSEAEWEYACRAGTQTPFYFGETITTKLANYNGNYVYGQGKKGEFREKTTNVGNFPANGFGLFDMHGNVWEWCADDRHKNYEGAPTDGSAWIDNEEKAKNRKLLEEKAKNRKLLRGGSWYHVPHLCRSAIRLRGQPVITNHRVGFRVACASARTL
jgi:formylglycine-generating enzyme required for sulfatase activity